MSETEWKVVGNRPIEKLTENLWRIEGDIPGMSLKRVMTVVRLRDGRLVVHNAIAMDEAAMAELDRFGEVGFVIVPNAYHRIDAPRFAARYPKAKVLSPPGGKTAVEKKVAVHGGFELLPSDPGLDAAMLAGVNDREGRLVVRSDDGATLVLNDAVFNMPHEPGVTGFVLRHLTQSTGGPRVTRVARFFLVADRRAFAADLARLAETPELRRVIVSHHRMITDAPAETLRAVAANA